MEENITKNSQALWHNFFSVAYLVLVAGATYYLKLQNELTRDISWFDFTLLVLATFRLAHLFTYDSITEHIRAYFRKFTSGYRKELSSLINCPWCTGIWFGLLVTFLFFLTPLAHFFILAVAISGLATFLQIVIWKIGLEPKEKDK